MSAQSRRVGKRCFLKIDSTGFNMTRKLVFVWFTVRGCDWQNTFKDGLPTPSRAWRALVCSAAAGGVGCSELAAHSGPLECMAELVEVSLLEVTCFCECGVCKQAEHPGQQVALLQH